jgi:hypothetical protein
MVPLIAPRFLFPKSPAPFRGGGNFREGKMTGVSRFGTFREISGKVRHD